MSVNPGLGASAPINTGGESCQEKMEADCLPEGTLIKGIMERSGRTQSLFLGGGLVLFFVFFVFCRTAQHAGS